MKIYTEEQVDFLFEEVEKILDELNSNFIEFEGAIDDLEELKRDKDFVIKRRFGSWNN